MRKQIRPLFVTSGVIISFVGLVVIVSVNLDWILGRYPGSTRVSAENLRISASGQSALSRQAKYQTPAPLLTVRQWYGWRYRFDPEAERNLNANGDCIWMRQSKTALRMDYAVWVLLCAMPQGGTRISVNESLALNLWP